MVYFAEATLGVDGAVQVKGSHNPRDDNGFKMVLRHRPFSARTCRIWRAWRRRVDWTEGAGASRRSTFSTPMSTGCWPVMRAANTASAGTWQGARGPVVEKLVQRLPGEHHTLFTDVDGHFPHHHPDPTVEANLDALSGSWRTRSSISDSLSTATGIGSRAIDGQGRVIWGDQILMLLAGPALAEHPGAPIVADVKASQALFDHIEALGGRPVMWKTGHS